MTKQAMGTLAKELESKGYLRRIVDEIDARAWRLCFTAKGSRLMLDTFEIVSEIEARVVKKTGKAKFQWLQASLAAISDEIMN